MRRALWGGITVGLLSVAALLGCEGDPNDPATWVKKLEEGALREKSVEELTRIYTDALNAAHGNNDDAKVKAIRDVVVPALVDAFKKFRDDVGSRDKILDALAAMHDARAEEIFIAALDFVPDLSEPQAVKGAEGLGVLRSQRGVDARWQVMPAWTRASILNVARMAWFSSDRTIREYAEDVWHVPVRPSPVTTQAKGARRAGG